MSVTMEEVRAAVEPDEPDYRGAAAHLGAAALPFLAELVQGEDPGLASKAASLAGNIDTAEARAVLVEAGRSPHVVVRIAAAGAVAGLIGLPVNDLLIALMSDKDPYVRKVALDSAGSTRARGTKEKVMDVAEHDPEEFVREVAKETLPLLG
jgi:HEAT repeat protein